MEAARDRLRDYIDLLLKSIDERIDGAGLARKAHLSRFHFDRVFAAALGETPTVFRRRLLLERAAWTLSECDDSATTIAFDAGYGSLEAFARAFARIFGATPTAYRSAGRRDYRAAAPSGVHFHPPGGLIVPGDNNDNTRRNRMTLPEAMLKHDRTSTRALIEAAQVLSEHVLDEPNALSPSTAAFAADAPSIREMLDRLVFTHEMWSAAIAGRSFAESNDRSLAAMLRRLDATDLVELAHDIAAREAWDTAFVDATCNPPQSFTFGGAVAHVLQWDSHRRQIVESALRARGAKTPALDPLSWN